MGCRVFTGQKVFREKFIKVREFYFVSININIDIWKENQIKLKYNIAGISKIISQQRNKFVEK